MLMRWPRTLTKRILSAAQKALAQQQDAAGKHHAVGVEDGRTQRGQLAQLLGHLNDVRRQLILCNHFGPDGLNGFAVTPAQRAAGNVRLVSLR